MSTRRRNFAGLLRSSAPSLRHGEKADREEHRRPLLNCGVVCLALGLGFLVACPSEVGAMQLAQPTLYVASTLATFPSDQPPGSLAFPPAPNSLFPGFLYVAAENRGSGQLYTVSSSGSFARFGTATQDNLQLRFSPSAANPQLLGADPSWGDSYTDGLYAISADGVPSLVNWMGGGNPDCGSIVFGGATRFGDDIFAANPSDGTWNPAYHRAIVRVSLAGESLGVFVPQGDGPLRMAISSTAPFGEFIYFDCLYGTTIYRVDPDAHVEPFATLPGLPGAMALAPAGSTFGPAIYVGVGSSVVRVNADGTTSTFATDITPSDIAFDPASGDMFIADGIHSEILRVRSASAPVTFSDEEFNDADWDVTVFQGGTGGVVTGSQQTSGGHPGAFRQVQNTVNTPATGQSSQVTAFHRRISATYSPGTQGTIASIDYAEDSRLISGSGQGQGANMALRQDGVVYVGPYFITPDYAWTHHAFMGLTAPDFVDVLTTATGVTTGTAHPDFSAAGSTMEFGFFRSNSVGVGGGRDSIAAGIDNWTVTVHSLACSVAITSSAGAGGTIAPLGTVSVGCGGSQTFAIAGDACHDIADVAVDGVSQGPITSYAFTELSGPHTITASFQPVFHVASVNFDRSHYASGAAMGLTIAVQSSDFDGSVSVTPTVHLRGGGSVSLATANASLTHGHTTSLQFAWTAPALKQQTIIDLEVTSASSSCEPPSWQGRGLTVVNQITDATLTVAEEQLQNCFTTAQETCRDASNPVNIAKDLLPFVGTVDGVLGTVSDVCLATQYTKSGRHVQSATMWLATGLDFIANGISAAGDLACLTTGAATLGVSCLPGPLLEMLPSVLSSDVTCFTGFLDGVGNSSLRASRVALSNDPIQSWLPDSLEQAFADAARPMADLVVLSGYSRLLIVADSTFTSADSVGHQGVVVLRVGAQPLYVAAVQPGASRLFHGGANASDASTIYVQATASDTMQITVIHRQPDGTHIRLDYAPAVLESGGIAALPVARDSVAFPMTVDANGDGHPDWIYFPGGAVTSVSRSNQPDTRPPTLELINVAPNPAFTSAAIYLRAAGSVQDAYMVVHDVAGRVMFKRDLGAMHPGVRVVTWDGCDNAGRHVAAGVYFIRLQHSRGRTNASRLIVLR